MQYVLLRKPPKVKQKEVTSIVDGPESHGPFAFQAKLSRSSPHWPALVLWACQLTPCPFQVWLNIEELRQGPLSWMQCNAHLPSCVLGHEDAAGRGWKLDETGQPSEINAIKVQEA